MTHIGYRVAYATKETNVQVIFRDRGRAEAYYNTLDMTIEGKTLQAGNWDAEMSRFTCQEVLAVDDWIVRERFE